MAKNISQPYIIMKQSTKRSKHGGTYTKVDMVGVNDRQMYHTYIDPTNFNFKNWEHIVRNPENGFVIRGIKVKNSKEYLVSADSKPIIEWEHDEPEVILSQLKEIWDSQDKEPPSTFRELFE